MKYSKWCLVLIAMVSCIILVTGVVSHVDEKIQYEKPKYDRQVSKNVKADVSALPETGDLAEGKKQSVTTSLDGKVYTFTPSKTGSYSFWIEDLGEDCDVEVNLYSTPSMSDCIMNSIVYRGGTYQVKLTAAHTYYLRVKVTEEDIAGIPVLIKFEKIAAIKAEKIKAEKKISVSVEYDKTKYYEFKPSVTGYYTIKLSGIDIDDNPVWMSLYDEDNKELANNTSYGKGGSFKSSKKLVAGKTYYVSFLSEISTKIKMQIHRNGEK